MPSDEPGIVDPESILEETTVCGYCDCAELLVCPL